MQQTPKILSSSLIGAIHRVCLLGGRNTFTSFPMALRRGNMSSYFGSVQYHIAQPLLSTCCHYSTKSSHLSTSESADDKVNVRLSKLIALGTGISRRNAETLIHSGKVSIDGQVVSSPTFLVEVPLANVGAWFQSSIKVSGHHISSSLQQDLQKHLISLASRPTASTSGDSTTDNLKEQKQQQQLPIRVWLVHKLKGELVTEHDPLGRPSMMERLRRGGVGASTSKRGSRDLLLPIGRLDMNTEGLIVITNNGSYSREMELPSNRVHRVYRARVHGLLTPSKLSAIRNGIEIDGISYKGMQVSIQQHRGGNIRETSTNTWLQITCQEGKNRQIRKIMEHLRRTSD